MTNNQITDRQIEIRSKWFARLFDLDGNQVKQVLKRLQAVPTHHIMKDFFTYYDWSPSLEQALTATRPRVILQMFANGDLEILRNWVKLTRELAGDRGHEFTGIEEICRWEAESYLLPD